MNDRKKTKSFNFLKPPRRIVKTLTCGVTALTINQGCVPGLMPVSEEELSIVNEIVVDGDNLIYPTMIEMTEAAAEADESNIFGFNGRGGLETFKESLEESDLKLREMVAAGRIFKVNDLDLDYFAFFGNNPLADGQDILIINQAYIRIAPLDEPYVDDDDEKKLQLSYGILLHEAAHNNGLEHSKETKLLADQDLVEEKLFNGVLEKNRDFPYLVGFIGEDVQNKFNSIVFDAVNFLEVCLDGERPRAGVYYDEEMAKSNVENFLSDYSTPEGLAARMIDEDDAGVLSVFLKIPLEKRREIIAETGWYEEFVEDDLKEIIESARKEFGLDVKEFSPPTEIQELQNQPNENKYYNGKNR